MANPMDAVRCSLKPIPGWLFRWRRFEQESPATRQCSIGRHLSRDDVSQKPLTS
jgi:hypothetical protein